MRQEADSAAGAGRRFPPPELRQTATCTWPGPNATPAAATPPAAACGTPPYAAAASHAPAGAAPTVTTESETEPFVRQALRRDRRQGDPPARGGRRRRVGPVSGRLLSSTT
ncbi:hypothetical protein GCM10010446_24880 [Streptomyces enissocaesilis]|uniref:Uncharacterized protein n=1 Tax=Streptomyces enissocaesilis TaxID=332589 RepID=A0ABP6JMZ6_9ACTN